MGINLSPILGDLKHEITLEHLSGWKIGIDAYNTIYSFLASIRDYSTGGSQFTDREGRVTSHLIGLFNRLIHLLSLKIKMVFVFDGEPPKLKETTLESRKKAKESAEEKYLAAMEAGDIQTAAKYAQATSRLDEQIINDTKRLLDAFGIPYLVAKSEAEAQIAYLAEKGILKATASQDYDALLFGSPILVRNVKKKKKRKTPGGKGEIEVPPQKLVLKEILEKLELRTREQLIYIGLLVGTDYNPKGIRGIGPKTALKMVKKYPSLEDLLDAVQKKTGQPLEEIFPYDPYSIVDLFKSPPVHEKIPKLEWNPVNYAEVEHFLCDERDFSRERVQKRLQELKKALSQSTLDTFF